MANTYYNSTLTAQQIDNALKAIDGVIAPENNGKILVIQNGKITPKNVTAVSGVVLESLSVSENGTYTPRTGVNGFDEVYVDVPGSATLQSKTVTPSASQQTVQPDSGYDGLSSVVVNGDADLVAGNIKKNVEIFGVTGTYEGGGGGGDSIHTVEYLECQSTGYGDPDASYDESAEPILDTFYRPTGNTKVVMVVSHSEIKALHFGMWDNSYNRSAFGFGNDGTVVYYGYANYGGGISGYLLDGNEHTITADKNVVQLDGTTIKTYGSSPSTTFYADRSLTLFTSNRYYNGGSAYDRYTRAWGPTTDRKFRLKSCKIYDGSVLACDMVPIRAVIDGNTIYGVYDYARKIILSVNHNSNFSVGPDTGTI